MASAKGIEAGKAYVRVGTEQSAFDKGLKAASAKLKAWGTGIAAVGASITAPMVALGGLFAERSRELLRMSEETGLSVESLTSLGYAASKTGGSMEDLETATNRMNRFLGEAANGSREANQQLAQLGLTLEDLEQRSTGDQFRLIADRLSRVGNQAQMTRAAFGIFGRGVGGLLPLIRQGAAGLERMEQAAHARGRIITTAEAEEGRAFFRELEEIPNALKTAAMIVGGALVPGLREAFGADVSIADAIIVIARATGNWLRQNAGLVTSIFRLGLGLTIAGGILFTIGTILPFLVGSMKLLTIATAAWSAVMWLGNPYLIAFIAGAAGGIAIVGLLASQLEGWPMLIQHIASSFDLLKWEFGLAWNGIRDAIMAGDLQLAFQILTSFLRIQWLHLVRFMADAWQGLWLTLEQTMLNGYVLMQRLMGRGEEAQRVAAAVMERSTRDAGDRSAKRAREIATAQDELAELMRRAGDLRAQQEARQRPGELPGRPFANLRAGGSFVTFSAQEAAGQAFGVSDELGRNRRELEILNEQVRDILRRADQFRPGVNFG